MVLKDELQGFTKKAEKNMQSQLNKSHIYPHIFRTITVIISLLITCLSDELVSLAAWYHKTRADLASRQVTDFAVKPGWYHLTAPTGTAGSDEGRPDAVASVGLQQHFL